MQSTKWWRYVRKHSRNISTNGKNLQKNTKTLCKSMANVLLRAACASTCLFALDLAIPTHTTIHIHIQSTVICMCVGILLLSEHISLRLAYVCVVVFTCSNALGCDAHDDADDDDDAVRRRRRCSWTGSAMMGCRLTSHTVDDIHCFCFVHQRRWWLRRQRWRCR